MALFNRDYVPLLIALLLNAAVWAGITISRTYVDVLFLSSYPVSFLPFFFLGQTVVILGLTLFISPLAAKASPFINGSIFFIAALSVVNGEVLVRADIPGVAFIFSLWLSAIPVLLLVMSQNTIADAFDVRRFKKTLTWVTMTGNLGGLLMGAMTPLIIRYFGIESLLYILVALIATVGLISAQLKPLPSPLRKHSQSQSPFNYPLFRTIALCTFLMMLVNTFTDYALKMQLGTQFADKEAIGSFMGPFYGISNALMVFLQAIGTQPLLKVFGVAGLISAIPLFAGFASFGLLFYPGLWSASILRLGENTLRFSFFSIGRELALKPLPAQIRRAGKFLIIAAGYVGAGVGSLLLLFFGAQMDLSIVAFILISSCIAWLITAKKLSAIYQDTLEEAIRIKRFNFNENGSMGQESSNILQVATLALDDSNTDNVRFGFTLLERADINRVPDVAYRHLHSIEPEIRVGFVSAVYRFRDATVVPMLMDRMDVESDGKVMWWLLKTLADLAPDNIIEVAVKLLPHEDALVRAGAVVALLSGGGLPHLILAANTLNEMLRHPNPTMRKGAAYAISALKIGKLENELRALLEDQDELVNIAAMWAVADQNNVNLTGALVAKLGHGRVSHYASRTLKRIGAPSIPYLLNIIESAGLEGRSQSAARAAVRVLVTITDAQADQAVLKAACTGSVLTRTQLARDCAMRTRNQPNSDLLVQQARQFVLDEAEVVRILKAARYSEELSLHARLEIAQRQKMAEARLLYWFDVYTKSTELIGVIPAILHDNTSQHMAAQHATAMEFLDTLTRDKVIKRALAVFEETVDPDTIPDAVRELPRLNDLWLRRVLHTKIELMPGGNMDITHKVMLLRKVKLFADLPGEILLTIAENCEDREIVRGEKMVSQGDPPDGLYIIASGVVRIEKDTNVLVRLKESDFFGELGLFDDAPRKADAIADTDGMVLFLEKEVFDGLTEDLPEVLRALVKTVISYVK